MKLYSMAGTCATAVHIALEWSGSNYEVEILARGDQHKVEYLAINPIGFVPSAILDDGTLVTEALAILLYVDRSFPGRFAPSAGPKRDITLTELLSFLSSEVHAAFKPHFAPFRYHCDQQEHTTVKSIAYDRIRRLMSLLDERISGPFFFGDHRSVADPYLYVLTRWLRGTPVELSDFPRLKAFSDTMIADDDVRSVLSNYG